MTPAQDPARPIRVTTMVDSLLAGGADNDRIAQALVISPQTARTPLTARSSGAPAAALARQDGGPTAMIGSRRAERGPERHPNFLTLPFASGPFASGRLAGCASMTQCVITRRVRSNSPSLSADGSPSSVTSAEPGIVSLT